MVKEKENEKTMILKEERKSKEKEEECHQRSRPTYRHTVFLTYGSVVELAIRFQNFNEI